MPSKKPFPPELSGSTEPTETAAAELRSARTRASAADGRCDGEVEEQATPTNRACDKCNEGILKPLRWGVDSDLAREKRIS